MNFPWILLAFVFLTLTLAVAWWGKRRIAIMMFCIFLIFACVLFWHHVTDALPIQL